MFHDLEASNNAETVVPEGEPLSVSTDKNKRIVVMRCYFDPDDSG
jgi:hypothetical protein